MSLSLSELLAPRTAAQWKSLLLSCLQGLGFVAQSGTGTGKVTISGAPAEAGSVLVTILTSGELGTGSFRYQFTDSAGAVTTGSPTLIPGGATYDIPDTGVTVTFVAGPSDSGSSFVANDTYSFDIDNAAFPVTAWQEGSVPRTMIEIFAKALADRDTLNAAMAAGGLLDYVTLIGANADAWLDLLGSSFYSLTRRGATATVVPVQLTCASGAGPYTILPGAVWVSDNDGHRYSNVDGGTLNSAGPLTLDFRAESTGTAYNPGGAGAITVLITALAGVTVTNTVTATTPGADRESNASYIKRCKARWPGLGGGATAAVYETWALEANDAVTRALAVTDGVTPGQIDVYIAGSSGGLDTETVGGVQTFIDSLVPLTSIALVASASEVTINVTATVYIKASQLAAATTAAEAGLAAYINGLPIGGDALTGSTQGVSWEKILGTLTAPSGVVNVTATGTDTLLTTDEVAVLNAVLTFTAV